MTRSCWAPEGLRHLELTRQGLTAFHVGSFVLLQSLDLSFNSITTLAGSGLEQLSQLHSVSFNVNKISK